LLTEIQLNLRKDLESQGIESLSDLDEQSLTKYVTRLIDSLESYVYTKNRVDLYHKEGIGLAIALDGNELDVEQYTSLYYKEMNSEGASKSSRTQSAEEYLRLQNEKTISRQNLYKKLFKTFDEARARDHQRDLEKENPDSGSGSNTSGDRQPSTDKEALKLGAPSNDKFKGDSQSNEDHPPPSSSSSSLSELDEDFNPSPAHYEISEEQQNETVKTMSWAQKINYYIRYYLWMNYIDHILFIHLA
jgi:hypothetical protein